MPDYINVGIDREEAECYENNIFQSAIRHMKLLCTDELVKTLIYNREHIINSFVILNQLI